ncbi:unnamed protein product [Brachionus calyciflorus]|uniref:tRNA-splicing endonuclease subunit Sen15 domain-containing protein n=1 Tax=Brachionus calyciflorus TaxID=104777 RepID=A0A813MUF8_9BILA|nr:unnamed protein product [Brachionus calyciflorus]
MNHIDSKNKTAAFHIYGDLCEVKNYGKIVAHLCNETNFIYFEAEPKPNEIEYILPIDENDSNFKIDLINNIINNINKNHGVPNKQITRIKLGITSIDFTTIYYDFTFGIQSPFTKEQLSKANQ